MSDAKGILGWFSKRRNDTVAIGNRNLAVSALDVVQELDNSVKAMYEGDKAECLKSIDRMTLAKRETVRLEDKLSIEIGDGTLSITEREDLLRLIRKTVKVAKKAYSSAVYIQMAVETETEIPQYIWEAMRQLTTELVLAVKMILKGYQALAMEDIAEIERCIDSINDQEKIVSTNSINVFKKILQSEMNSKAVFLAHGFIDDVSDAAEACKVCADMMSIIVSTRVI